MHLRRPRRAVPRGSQNFSERKSSPERYLCCARENRPFLGQVGDILRRICPTSAVVPASLELTNWSLTCVMPDSGAGHPDKRANRGVPRESDRNKRGATGTRE